MHAVKDGDGGDNYAGICRGGEMDGRHMVAARYDVAMYAGRRKIDGRPRFTGAYIYSGGEWVWTPA